MIIPDTNLLLYAHHRPYPQHEAARAWWKGAMDAREPVGIPSAVTFGFIRISTNRKILATPYSIEQALTIVESWFRRDDVYALREGPRHREIAFALLRSIGVGGNLTTDVHLAAFAIEHNATVYTNDADFARMPGVAWRNPLAR